MQTNHQPIAVELPALWREYQEAAAQCEASELDFDEDPAYSRYEAAFFALRDARPTDLPGIITQLEWLSQTPGMLEQEEILEHAAQSLKALALPLPAVTDSMVMAAMETETVHRHAGAEERVRAILAAALEVEPIAEEDEPLVALEEAWRQAIEINKAALETVNVCFNRQRKQGLDFQQACDSAEHQAAETHAAATLVDIYDLERLIGGLPTRTLTGASVKARLLHWLFENDVADNDRAASCAETLSEALGALVGRAAA